MPFFSIVIPVWRAEHLLGECLSSLHRQTFGDFECWVVDDGSPGVEVAGALLNTAQVLSGVCAGDRRFHLLHQTNAGQGMARQNGIDHATGQYLVLVDADDSLAPDFLEIAATALQNRSGHTLFFNDVVADVGGEHRPLASTQDFVPTVNSIQTALFFPTYTMTPFNYFYELSLVRRHAVRFRTARGEDTFFFFDYLFAYHKEYGVLPALRPIEATYFYRIDPESAASTTRQSDFQSRLQAGKIWYFSLRLKDFRAWGWRYYLLAWLFLSRQRLYHMRQSSPNQAFRLLLNVLVKPLTLVSRVISGAKKKQ